MMPNITTNEHQIKTKCGLTPTPSKAIGAFSGPLTILASSACCIVILNTILNRIHEILKNILTTLCIHNILSSLLALSLLIYSTYVQSCNYIVCSILCVTFVSSLKLSIEHLGLISFCKYHLAKQMEKLEDYKTPWIIYLTGDVSNHILKPSNTIQKFQILKLCTCLIPECTEFKYFWQFKGKIEKVCMII